MDHLHLNIPPLDPLVAFEAAARLGSFARAAEELALSQAAVSQRIRHLEDAVGAALFLRANRRVQLTRAGRLLQQATAPALRNIAAASEEIRARQGGNRLTIGADNALTTMWLMPLLNQFRDLNEDDLSVRLAASDREEDCLADDLDLAILHGDGTWEGRDAVLLFSEEVFPVCAPEYLMKNPPVIGPEYLPAHPLLELEDPRHTWMSWRSWLADAGVPDQPLTEPLRINAYTLIIEEAKAGRGIALGWRNLVDAELAAGTLVRPVADSVKTKLGYYLTWRMDYPLDPTPAAFRDWLIRQAPGR